MLISIIVAVGNSGQIGLKNKLPWKLNDDLENFKILTSGNVIIMGRKTFESIGRVLPNRINVIISRNINYKIDGAYVFNSLNTAIGNFKDKKIFICGGVEIYKEALNGKYQIDNLYITQVDYDGPADTFFPKIDYSRWKLVSERKYFKNVENEYDFLIKVFKKYN